MTTDHDVYEVAREYVNAKMRYESLAAVVLTYEPGDPPPSIADRGAALLSEQIEAERALTAAVDAHPDTFRAP